MREIERKFLVKTLPNLSSIEKVRYERHFLYYDFENEIRIQKKGNNFELERKGKYLDGAGYNKTKIIITEKEFNALKKHAIKSIERTGYFISEYPGLSIKIYDGQFDGLARAEFEFDSVEKAEAFKPFDWMGKEITDTDLARDSKLIDLTRDQFENLLNSFK